MNLSQKCLDLVASADARLNKRAGYKADDIRKNLEKLQSFGVVESGWRESCGTTDATMFIHREWVRVVKQLQRDGVVLTEERQEHGNGFATLKGGFWASIVYRIEKQVAE